MARTNTSVEKILKAADQISNRGAADFTLYQVVVRVWELFPADFGIPGFVDRYPDTHKVLGSIYGENGLIGRGYFRLFSEPDAKFKRYILTVEGLKFLLHSDDSVNRKGGTTSDEVRIAILLRTDAFAYYLNDQKQMITFADATEFFAITKGAQGNEVNAFIEKTVEILNRIETVLEHNKGYRVGHRKIEVATINVLRNLCSFLEEKFKSHLNLLRNRKKEKNDD